MNSLLGTRERNASEPKFPCCARIFSVRALDHKIEAQVDHIEIAVATEAVAHRLSMGDDWFAALEGRNFLDIIDPKHCGSDAVNKALRTIIGFAFQTSPLA